MSTKNKIYVLGDSFCEAAVSFVHSESGLEVFWVSILDDYFKHDYEILQYAEGSRDLQTIIDTWIKLLPNITENDFLIVGIPYYTRYRLPRHKHFYRIENELVIRHIGHHGDYDVQSNNLEFYDSSFSRDFIHDSLRGNEIINSSIASTLNYKEVLESLSLITKCNSYMFSWTRFKDGYKPIGLEDKTDLENKLGYWGTQQDTYNRTKGKYGKNGDLHWDEKTHKIFAKYLQAKIKTNII